MQLSDIITLINAGYTKDDIIKMSEKLKPEPKPEEPESQPKPEPKPEEPKPEEPETITRKEYDDLMTKIDNLTKSINKMSLTFISQPPEGTENILAEIIDPVGTDMGKYK